MLRIDTSAVDREKIEKVMPEVLKADKTLKDKTGAGAEYTGWVTLPRDYDKDE